MHKHSRLEKLCPSMLPTLCPTDGLPTIFYCRLWGSAVWWKFRCMLTLKESSVWRTHLLHACSSMSEKTKHKGRILSGCLQFFSGYWFVKHMCTLVPLAKLNRKKKMRCMHNHHSATLESAFETTASRSSNSRQRSHSLKWRIWSHSSGLTQAPKEANAAKQHLMRGV